MQSIRDRLLYAGLSREVFHSLIPQARRENEEKLRVYTLFALGLFLLLIALNAIVKIFPTKTIVSYGIMALFNAALYLLTRLLRNRCPKAITSLCYVFIAGLYLFALYHSATHPELPAVAGIALLLMGPFLFTERPLNLIGMNIAMVVALCAVAIRLKTGTPGLIDLWNALAFGVISVAAELAQESLRFKLLAQTERIRYLSETDVLTGCKNRNCYQDRLPRFGDYCRKGLVSAYIDVNGLHNLNDSQGHAAGDAMLIAVARALLDSFGGEHTYRIGGDEFVVLRPDADREQTAEALRKVSATLEEQGYFISVGIRQSDKSHLDIEAMLKDSEKDMYAQKDAYYALPGRDRRRR